MTRRLYSIVTRGLWSDARFLSLSGPEPNAQTLWLYLLTGEVQGPIPGLFRAGVGALSDALGWSYEGTARAWGELLDAGLIRVSLVPPLVWLPKAVLHNPPASPNVVRSWGAAYRELPECDLREEAMLSIRELLPGEAHQQALDETFKPSRKPWGKPSPKPSPKASPKPSGKAFGVQREILSKVLLGGGGGDPGEETLQTLGETHEGPEWSIMTEANALESGLFPDRKPSPKASPKGRGKGGGKPPPNQDQGSGNIYRGSGASPEGPQEGARRLSLDLLEAIRSHTPAAASRSKPKGWEKDLEKLLRIDKASEEEVRKVIRWAHQGDPSTFWRGNLLSGSKVRQHFDRLSIQARGKGAPVLSSAPAGSVKSWLEENHRWLLRVRDEHRASGLALTESRVLDAARGDDIPTPINPGALLRWLETRP